MTGVRHCHGFWSVSVYNAEDCYQKNQYDAYALNNIAAKREADGSIAIQFGGCYGKVSNRLPIMNRPTTGCDSIARALKSWTGNGNFRSRSR